MGEFSQGLAIWFVRIWRLKSAIGSGRRIALAAMQKVCGAATCADQCLRHQGRLHGLQALSVRRWSKGMAIGLVSRRRDPVVEL
jgi:hypothetical protein